MARKVEKFCEVNGYKIKGLDEDQVICIVNEDYGPVVVYYNEYTTRSGDLARSVQIRKFYQPDGTNYYTFTKQGATVPTRDVPTLVEALMAWCAENGDTGLFEV